jgi:hypothetical protein
LAAVSGYPPFISRNIPYVELLGEEGLRLIEANAETILTEIGVEFRDDPEALEIWRAAGADVTGRIGPHAARHVPQAHSGSCPARVHAARTQSGAQHHHRRQAHRVRPHGWPALRALPRQGPPLWHD